MSSMAASALRHLEKLLEKTRHGVVRISRNPPKLLEYVMVKLIRLGIVVENNFIKTTMTLTRYLDLLQRSLHRSTLLASLWIGLLFTMAFLVIALLTMHGGILWG